MTTLNIIKADTDGCVGHSAAPPDLPITTSEIPVGGVR
jgi:hypothetical protein